MVNINLVPENVKGKIAQAKFSANIFSICLVGVILLGVLGVLAKSANTMLLQPNLEAVKADITKNKSDLTAFADLENKALFLNDRAKVATEAEQKRPVWSEIIQDLINSVPQQIQFVSLTVDVNKSPNFILDGSADNEQDIISFKDKLENSDFFKNVAFKSSTTQTQSATTQTTTPTDQTAQVAQKKMSFSLEFDLEKYFITTTGATK